MQHLETDRLILRDWSIEDAEDLFAYAANPNIGSNAGWKPHESLEESIGIIQRFINSRQVWAIELKDNHKVIGSFGLHKDPHRSTKGSAMLGYVISEEYWGRGLAAEAGEAVIKYAFENPEIKILSIYHYDFNPRSGRVAQKLGFIKEGELMDSCELYDGRICGEVLYRLSRKDYFSK